MSTYHPTARPRVWRVENEAGETVDFIPADPCSLCGGTGKGEFDYASQAHDKCSLCLGRRCAPVEFTVDAPCRLLLADGCEGRACDCHGAGRQTLRLLAWELDAKPVGVGTAAERAEAKALLEACDAAEAEHEAAKAGRAA